MDASAPSQEMRRMGPSNSQGKFVTRSTGGEVANALVCKTSIHGFNSHPVLQ